MAIELWGTFSVRDHLVDRAFVADVLLYDRLVLPTLPEQTPENEWPESWNLAKQKTLLRDLGTLPFPFLGTNSVEKFGRSVSMTCAPRNAVTRVLKQSIL
jgi:hypothetical protein